MKKSILFTMLTATLVFAMAGCDVEQTREGELPTVDVEGGAMPAYDVHGPDVDVSTKESRVRVPDVDVDVDMKEKTVTTPDVDITLPEDK